MAVSEEQQAVRPTIQQLDELVKAVAERLAIDASVEAELGGTGVLQIVLGHPGGPHDPVDSAGIDPAERFAPSLWWVDLGGGEWTETSSLGPDAAPELVAQWVADTYEALVRVRTQHGQSLPIEPTPFHPMGHRDIGGMPTP